MEQALLKLLESPNIGGSWAAFLAVACVFALQVRKMLRADSGEHTVDATYKGILAQMKEQHEQCLRQNAECEARVKELEARIAVLERDRGTGD